MDVGETTLGTSASVGALHHQSSHLNLSSAASNGNAPSSSRAATARASVPWTRRPSVFFALCALATTVLALMTHEGRSTTCERAPEYVVFVDAGRLHFVQGEQQDALPRFLQEFEFVLTGRQGHALRRSHRPTEA